MLRIFILLFNFLESFIFMIILTTSLTRCNDCLIKDIGCNDIVDFSGLMFLALLLSFIVGTPIKWFLDKILYKSLLLSKYSASSLLLINNEFGKIYLLESFNKEEKKKKTGIKVDYKKPIFDHIYISYSALYGVVISLSIQKKNLLIKNDTIKILTIIKYLMKYNKNIIFDSIMNKVFMYENILRTQK